MNLEIVPLAEPHFGRLREVLDSVAREKRFLAFTQAPPPEQAFAFYRNIVLEDWVASVAFAEGELVGWCDVLPTHGQARSHIGILGIGLIASARHRGIGRPLIEHAIARAWAQGLSRIELSVRSDNGNAKALYERVGFKTEGLNERAFRIDGSYYDAISMALLR